MFFTLSKLSTFALQPSSLMWLGILAGFVLSVGTTRLRRFGIALSIVAITGLFVAGLSPLANIVLFPLEQRFPARTPAGIADPVAGIIVLGGAEDGWVSAGRGSLALNEAGERITETLRLARAHSHAKVVISGGVARLYGDDQEGSSAVATLLEELGVDENRVIVETHARNTYENATKTLPLIATKPGETWLIVTSAYHMPRAVGVFRKVGLDVVAYPVDFRMRGQEDLSRWFASLPAGLQRFDLAAKEWAGLLAYYMTGRSQSWFPGP
ncbi:MAG TPA: YdcF family protein [Hyphomicrobiaceae bacterium]|nr:YdcF family protein [Hyphomicrobiaceae bacterium]